MSQQSLTPLEIHSSCAADQAHDCAHEHSHDHNHELHHKHGHSHSHGHHHAGDNIRMAFILNFVFSLIEIFGGTLIGSMAIVANAIHDFGDSVSLGCAWFLERYSNRRRDTKFNFGYRRFSLLSALLAGVVISSGSGVVIWESFKRLQAPQMPSTGPMLGLAIVGLLVNGLAALRLSKGRSQNEKVLTWHLIEDVLGWAAVLLGAIAIYLSGVSWIDPILAIALSCFVSFNVLRHLKDTLYLFLQGRPESFSETLFLSEALKVPGVEKVDHLAVWSLDGEHSILSARLHLHALRDPHTIELVKTKIRELAQNQGASQTTLETCLSDQASHVDEYGESTQLDRTKS
jgi:cobalt-zinc-cadmium efflux system protein